MEITAPIGTKEWIAQVRGTPPVRDPLGRSRPTHQFAPYSRTLRTTVGIEGGNELTAHLLLEVLVAAGLVKWCKPQPFSLTPAEHGIEATPDFAFQWRDDRVFVAEVKSKTYINQDVLDKAQQLTKLFEQQAVAYVMWNDKDHVSRAMWSNTRRLWNSRGQLFTDEELQATNSLIVEEPQSLGDLLRRGASSDAVYHLVDEGKAHFDLATKRSLKSLIGRKPNESWYEHLLGSRVDPESWWNSIPDQGPGG